MQRSQQSVLSPRGRRSILERPIPELGQKGQRRRGWRWDSRGALGSFTASDGQQDGGRTSVRPNADCSQNCGPQTVLERPRLSAGPQRGHKTLRPPAYPRRLGQVPSGESTLPPSTDGGSGWARKGGQLSPLHQVHTHTCTHMRTRVHSHVHIHTHTNTLTLTLSHLPPHISRECPHPCL